jgi:hypothetical protein
VCPNQNCCFFSRLFLSAPARRKYLLIFFAASLIEFGRAPARTEWPPLWPRSPPATHSRQTNPKSNANTLDHLEPRESIGSQKQLVERSNHLMRHNELLETAMPILISVYIREYILCEHHYFYVALQMAKTIK